MSDPAQVNRSLGTIRTELEYLASAGLLSPPQFQSIQAQLPVRREFLLFPRLQNLAMVVLTIDYLVQWPTITVHRSQVRSRRKSIQSCSGGATGAGS